MPAMIAYSSIALVGILGFIGYIPQSLLGMCILFLSISEIMKLVAEHIIGKRALMLYLRLRDFASVERIVRERYVTRN